VVALVINKSSTPFTNKGGKTEKADLTSAQLQDPNKPLYGNKEVTKEAAKEVAADAAKAAERQAPDIKPVDSKPAVAAPAKQAEAAPASAAAAIDDKYVYFLQVGAFHEQADAESTRAKLALLGFEARINEKQGEANLYRVRIGPFNQVDTMNRIRTKLSENSVEAVIVRSSK
jgi:cell division protein FtsN